MQQVLGLVLEAQDRHGRPGLDVRERHALDPPAGNDRMAVGAGGRVADGRPNVGLEARGHRVLEPFGLLVDVVPRHAHDVGEEPLDQSVARHDLLGVAPALVREVDGLFGVARDVAVALQTAEHLVHGRRGQLHGPGEVRAGHGQARLVQPEQRLEVLLLGDGGVGHDRQRMS